jgi:hypothetical protein
MVKLADLGMPGVSYLFAGEIKKLVLDDGRELVLNRDPWKLKDKQLIEISRGVDLTINQITNTFIELHDILVKKPKEETRAGKNPEKVISSWEDVVKIDAKGSPTGLNTEAIAILLAPGHARIDDVIFKVGNNIGDMLSEEKLKIDILHGLKTVGAGDLYAMNTYKLVRDQMLPLIPESTLGNTLGYLPVLNGVLDIRKGELIQAGGIYLKTANTVFDVAADKCPKIETMLNNMFKPEQKELVLSVLGAAISGRRAPFILVLSGSGRNGKSILRELLEGLMADLITTEKLENLSRDFVNGVFLGKKISWQTEVDSSRKITTMLKDVTGGTTIQVRKKYVNGELQYPLQMVAILDTNSPPHLDESEAINDRVRFIDMPHRFVYKLTGAENEILINAELTENWQQELPAFLNLLLPYAKHFLDNGTLKYDMNDTMCKMKEKSGLLSDFLDKYCNTDDFNRSVSMTTFYKYFVKYAKANNVAVPEKEHVSYKLRKEYGMTVRANKITGISMLKEVRLDAIADE